MLETRIYKRINDGAECQNESSRELNDEDYLVEAVLLTQKNIHDVSEWCGFPVITNPSSPFRDIALHTPHSKRYFASFGDMVFKKNYNTYGALDHKKFRERYTLS